MHRTRRDTEFAELVTATSTQLMRSAYLLTGSVSEAEDVKQSALAKAYAAWPRVRDADDPIGYVHTIVVNTFVSARRRRSSTEIPVAELPERGRHDPDVAERESLLAALRTLTPTDRAVVVLRYWQDRSVAETAASLDLSEAAVKNRSLRALRTLQALLVSDPPDDLDTPSRTTRARSPR